MKLIPILLAVMLFGCAGAVPALQVIGPIAAETLTQIIKSRGGEVNEETAWCVELSDDPEVAKVTAETGEVYALCGAEEK